jgi:hypothetical protein
MVGLAFVFATSLAVDRGQAFAQVGPAPVSGPAAPPVPGPGPQQGPRPADELDYRWTVMWAPLRALFGLAEFTGEYRFHERFGVSVMAGAGRRKVTSPAGFGTSIAVHGNELEGGIQARYYAVRRGGHALHFGAEFMYERIKFDEPLPPGIFAAAAGGGTLGPFIGYKLVTRVGFTFEAQMGARYLVMDPRVTGEAALVQIESSWGPVLHLNVGWSF